MHAAKHLLKLFLWAILQEGVVTKTGMRMRLKAVRVHPAVRLPATTTPTMHCARSGTMRGAAHAGRKIALTSECMRVTSSAEMVVNVCLGVTIVSITQMISEL